ncbi:MAG: hypothetical protein K8S98_06730 [Planctomycetes bacterium]|nr:hypothetical protein [Planctomycetota bacterium]
MIRLPLRIASLLAVAPLAAAQLPAEVLVRQGDPTPGLPGATVEQIGLITVNSAGGFACAVGSDNAGSKGKHIVGTAGGGAPVGLLRSEQLGIQGYDQHFALASSGALRIGIDDLGQVAYGCTIGLAGSGTPGTESIWLDGTLVASEWAGSTNVAGASITRDGRAVWVGNNKLYIGSASTVLFDPSSLGGLQFSFDKISRYWEVAPSGAHYIVGLGSSPNLYFPRYLVVDGVLATAGGQPIEISKPVPAAAGGSAGETWNQIEEVAISNSGSWAFSGSIKDASGALLTVVVVDGAIRHRQGDPLGGGLLGSPQQGMRPYISLDDQGVLAMVAAIDLGFANTVTTLFYDDIVVTNLGDSVDLDGDGFAETTTGVASLHLNERGPAIGADRSLYVHALVDDNGTVFGADDEQCALRAPIPPIPYGHGKTSSVGLEPKISYSGTPRLATHDFAVRVDDLVPNKPGQLFYGAARNAAPFVGGTLLVSMPLVRMPPVHANAQGQVTISVAIAATMPGTVRRYQFWQRDPLHPDGTQACLSNALEVSFFP